MYFSILSSVLIRLNIYIKFKLNRQSTFQYYKCRNNINSFLYKVNSDKNYTNNQYFETFFYT